MTYEHEKEGSAKDLNVFTIIAIFNVLLFPIGILFDCIIFKGILPWAFGNILSTRVSYKRIKEFLNMDEIDKS